jgi:hypothetical protein
MASTGIPTVDFVLDQLPLAEDMLDAMGQPELALYLTALAAAAKVVEAVMVSKQFDATAAIETANATAMAALRTRFPK